MITDSKKIVTAARALREGSSVRQVAQQLDITEDQVRDLVRDIPGLDTTDKAPARTAAAGDVTDLPISALLAHPSNIRTDLGDIDELADTIRQHGILQPLLVTATVNTAETGTYVVLDGHRRLAAALVARHRHVPVVVRGHTSTAEAVAIMLVTGLQKQPLDPIDEANAYRQLEDAGYTQTNIAGLVKKNQGHISQRLSLLNLTPAEQDAVRAGGVTLGEAYRTGRDRSPNRRPNDTHRPKPKNVLHFNQSHPLAAAASDLCRKAGHEVLLKLGPACGPCWETTIRRDTLAALEDGAA